MAFKRQQNLQGIREDGGASTHKKDLRFKVGCVVQQHVDRYAGLKSDVCGVKAELIGINPFCSKLLTKPCMPNPTRNRSGQAIQVVKRPWILLASYFPAALTA
jgi:hypothetical protein